MEIFKCTLSKVEIVRVLHNLYIYRHYMKIKKGVSYGNRTRTSQKIRQGHFRRGHVTFGHYGCSCAHPREPRRGQVTLGHIRQPWYYCTTSKKKTRGKPGMRRTYFQTRPLPVRHVTNVISGEKAPLGRILRTTQFRTGQRE